jgi:hypothetical protein
MMQMMINAAANQMELPQLETVLNHRLGLIFKTASTCKVF